jgi:hypothetical protein
MDGRQDGDAGGEHGRRGDKLWDELVGPFYDITSICRSLDVSPDIVRRMVERGELLGLPLEGGEIIFPSRQFGERVELLPGLPEALAAMRARLDPWGSALWLLQPSPIEFHELTAVEMMRAGKLEPVLTIAQELGKFWDS